MQNYQDLQTAFKYLEFLNSNNGEIQQQVLYRAIKQRLADNQQAIILDAGCGPGWLCGLLKKKFDTIFACDSSEFFINFARTNYSGVDFKVASLNNSLPYQPNAFNFVILNMVAPDLSNLDGAFKNVAVVLKTGGKLLITIPNPKLTYPAAEWKRNLLDVLLLRKPKLKIKNPPNSGQKIQREFGQGVKIDSYYYTLENYITAAKYGGLKLVDTIEIKSQIDSPEFDLNYQLYRYPLILLLEFTKV